MITETRGFCIGDKVRIDGEIVRFESRVVAIVQCVPGYRIEAHVNHMVLVERPAPPAKVGDRIVPYPGRPMASGEATIKAIDGENWWVHWDAGDYQTVRSVEFMAEQMYRRVPA